MEGLHTWCSSAQDRRRVSFFLSAAALALLSRDGGLLNPLPFAFPSPRVTGLPDALLLASEDEKSEPLSALPPSERDICASSACDKQRTI